MLQSQCSGRSLKRTICVVILLWLICGNAPAWAGTILSLPIKGGGVFNFGEGERRPRFSGRGIRVGDLSYGSNILPILKGHLSFKGGSFLHSGNNSWLWGQGGSISVGGCADLNHDGVCGAGDFKGSLITGSFLSAELVSRNGKEFLEAQILEQLNPQLAALLNLPNTTYRGVMELSLVKIGGGRWWVREGVQGGFLNGGTIPEASSVWLLGASLICLAAGRFGLRRLGKSKTRYSMAGHC